MRIAPPSPQAAREVRRDTPLRRARTCYGHLAGVAGVALMDELLRRGWLEVVPAGPDVKRVHYSPTADGVSALSSWGVAIPAPKGRKPVAFSCLDWTERRWHLGGPLGRAIADALAEAGCIRRLPGSRVVELIGDASSFLTLDAPASLR